MSESLLVVAVPTLLPVSPITASVIPSSHVCASSTPTEWDGMVEAPVAGLWPMSYSQRVWKQGHQLGSSHWGHRREANGLHEVTAVLRDIWQKRDIRNDMGF